MIVLSRGAGEAVMIGRYILIETIEVRPASVRFRITGGPIGSSRFADDRELVPGGSLSVAGAGVRVKLALIRGDRARIGIISPPHLEVHRKEVYDEIARHNDARDE